MRTRVDYCSGFEQEWRAALVFQGEKNKLTLAKKSQSLVLANREIKMHLSLHPNSFISVEATPALPGGPLPLRSGLLNCLVLQGSKWLVWGSFLLSLTYVKSIQWKILFVPYD